MTQPDPRRRHLIDFDNPPPPPSQRSLTSVQQWIVSTLVVTTILHLALGLCAAAYFADPVQRDARIGLLVVAGAFGVVAVGAGFLVHRRSPLSPWIALGVLPAVACALLMFG